MAKKVNHSILIMWNVQPVPKESMMYAPSWPQSDCPGKKNNCVKTKITKELHSNKRLKNKWQ
jgi:hypothetical protein